MAGRPKVYTAKRRTFTMKLREELIDAADAVAHDHKTTRTAVFDRILGGDEVLHRDFVRYLRYGAVSIK